MILPFILCSPVPMRTPIAALSRRLNRTHHTTGHFSRLPSFPSRSIAQMGNAGLGLTSSDEVKSLPVELHKTFFTESDVES